MMLNLEELRDRCAVWVKRTYGRESFADYRNRAARVAEEGVELAQAEGVDKKQMLAIVERCYARPVGKVRQEGAGVFFTLLVWSKSRGVNVFADTVDEVDRVESKDVEHFRAKQREKFEAGTDLIQPL